MGQDYRIFEILKPDGNDKLSKMPGLELQEILFYINKYYLELKSSIDLNSNDTFGFEIEVEKLIKKRIENSLKSYIDTKNWKLKIDPTLDYGNEITTPILYDKKEIWQDIKNVCNLLRKDSIIWLNSAGHIHVGTQVLGGKPNSWLNFIHLWSIYENVIYRFLYGEYLTARYSISTYAKPLALKFYNIYQRLNNSDYNISDIIGSVDNPKGYAINFKNVKDFDKILDKNTIECRVPNSSLNSIIWQNNTKFLVSFIKYCTIDINNDILEKRKQINGDIYDNLFFYEQIYLEQALELCDMIFDKNVDKIYFLRQYLKSFQIGHNDLEKAKVFTKN